MADPDFEPERHTITAITNATNAAVTTLAAHGYSSDETVLLNCSFNIWYAFRLCRN